MNDPFPCETRVDGIPCAGHATHVYRSAHATRLICDECTTAYRMAARGPRKTAIVEFTLLEFIPAREALQGQVETMKLERDRALEEIGNAVEASRVAYQQKEKAVNETNEAWGKLERMHQTLARAVVLSKLYQDGQAITDRWVLWVDAVAVLLSIGAQLIWGGAVGLEVFAGLVFGAYWIVHFIVQRCWVRPRLKRLNEGEAGIQ